MVCCRVPTPIFPGRRATLLGSWTPFNKKISTVSTEKCIQEYLPVTAEPPEYPVCKEYLDFLLEIMKDLEIPYIYVHSDEAVYSKLCHILWKNKDLYRDVILLMGGFHQLRVRQNCFSSSIVAEDTSSGVWMQE